MIPSEDPPPHVLVERLCALMRLTRVEQDRFMAQSEDLGGPAVFGGQLLGQALMAASHTVASGRAAHSMHAYFLRAARPAPITYEVERLRDGRSFSLRRVKAQQDGHTVFEMTSSFQCAATGVSHQDRPPQPRGPEGLQSEREQLIALGDRRPAHWRAESLSAHGIEYRQVDPVDLLEPSPCSAESALWVRAVSPLPAEPALHQALIAYLSDNGPLRAALRPHGVTLMQTGVRAASLDHAIWFYRDGTLDDWMLHTFDSPTACSQRALCRGMLFDRQGRLLAATAQEGMLQVPQQRIC